MPSASEHLCDLMQAYGQAEVGYRRSAKLLEAAQARAAGFRDEGFGATEADVRAGVDLADRRAMTTLRRALLLRMDMQMAGFAAHQHG